MHFAFLQSVYRLLISFRLSRLLRTKIHLERYTFLFRVCFLPSMFLQIFFHPDRKAFLLHCKHHFWNPLHKLNHLARSIFLNLTFYQLSKFLQKFSHQAINKLLILPFNLSWTCLNILHPCLLYLYQIHDNCHPWNSLHISFYPYEFWYLFHQVF